MIVNSTEKYFLNYAGYIFKYRNIFLYSIYLLDWFFFKIIGSTTNGSLVRGLSEYKDHVRSIQSKIPTAMVLTKLCSSARNTAWWALVSPNIWTTSSRVFGVGYLLNVEWRSTLESITNPSTSDTFKRRYLLQWIECSPGPTVNTLSCETFSPGRAGPISALWNRRFPSCLCTIFTIEKWKKI